MQSSDGCFVIAAASLSTFAATIKQIDTLYHIVFVPENPSVSCAHSAISVGGEGVTSDTATKSRGARVRSS